MFVIISIGYMVTKQPENLPYLKNYSKELISNYSLYSYKVSNTNNF